MNITDGLSRQAALRPWAIAVLGTAGVVHYGALDRMAARASGWLRRRGVVPGQVVGLTFHEPLNHLVAALALARCGAVQVALAPGDPVAMRRRVADLAGVSAVAGDGEGGALADWPFLRPESGWLDADAPAEPALRHEDGASPWLVSQSSGTTGTPKLFHLSHDDTAARERRESGASLVRADDVFFSPVALDFSAAKLHMLTCLNHGGALVLERHGSLHEIAARLDACRVSYIYAPPTWAAAMLQICAGDKPRFPRLRVLRLGAGASDEALRQAVLRGLSPNLFASYGTNDAGGIAVADPAAVASCPGTIGTILEGLRWEVVDGEDRPLPAGTPGRLRLSGPGVVTGYLDPQLDARHLKDGWFYPGDMVSADAAGRLTFHGRVDDMMNFDGIKIFPAEIEQVLLAHPAVAEAAAFPLRVMTSRDVPMAAVVLRRPVDGEELVGFCRERLGVRSPRRVFVLDALPRNAVGKVLRRELSARLRA
ncbi:class I adenylate-forming enzyme family protein [Marinimicrococcus flavescens]|uniref:Class I adenylate-forming enzyme family protein n=1 Tax=Marinimicrococcus flavescens TaxID=3031815 RepID=A0AAP3XRS7_9PROT|nr:class I adenylate-forming enzyme family protein [Marinimicrococcus flavescens]